MIKKISKLFLNKIILFSVMVLMIVSVSFSVFGKTTEVNIITPDGTDIVKGNYEITWSVVGLPDSDSNFVVEVYSGGTWNTIIDSEGNLANRISPAEDSVLWGTNYPNKEISDGTNYQIRVIDWTAQTFGYSVFFTVDNNAPVSSATDNLPDYKNAEEVPFHIDYTTDEDFPGSGVASVALWYSLDGGTWQDSGLSLTGTSGTFEFNPPQDGSYEFYTIATDIAGNVEDAPDTADTSTIVDTKDPTATLTVEPEGLTKFDSIDFIKDCSDDGSGIADVDGCVLEVNFNSEGYQEITDPSPYDLTVNGDGTYDFRVTATDKAGNTNTATKQVVRDTTPPTVTITNAPSITTYLVGVGVVPQIGCDEETCIDSKMYTSSEEIINCPETYSTEYTTPSTIATPLWVCAAAKDSVGNIGYSSPVQFRISETIQDAITAASSGDTIEVSAKAEPYTEDLWIEGKDNLEIYSPDGAVIKGLTLVDDALTYYAEEPNIMILSDGVKIHGFTLESKNSEIGYHPVGITISGSNIEIYDNDFKLAVGSGYGVGITTYCDDTFCAAGPYNNNVDISGLNIHDNTFDSLTGTGKYQAIYLNPDIGSGSVTIKDNVFGGDLRRAVTTERSNTLIQGNTINSNLAVADTNQGISLVNWYNNDISNVDIFSNTINGFSKGISLASSSVTGLLSDIVVTGNIIKNSETGIHIYRSADNVLINENTISDNTIEVQNDDAAILNAESNYWGILGPTTEKFVGNVVDFVPFYTDAEKTTLSTYYTVCTNGCNFDNIQESIDAVDTGDIIYIKEGTYQESILVDKRLTIIGEGKELTIIDPPIDQYGFRITADNVAIQNLQINIETSGVNTQAIRVEGSPGIIILGNKITTTGNKGVGIWVCGSNNGCDNVVGMSISDNVITINDVSTGIYADFSNPRHSTWIIKNNIINSGGTNLELYDVEGSTIENNIFGGNGNTVSLVYASEFSNLYLNSDIIDNTFNGNGDIAGVTPTIWIESDFYYGDGDTSIIGGVTITGNTFNDWTNAAIKVGGVDSESPYSQVSGVIVNQNKFLKVAPENALLSYISEEIDAIENYWGAPNGPTHTENEYGTGSVVSNNVNYSPWCVSFDEGICVTDEVDPQIISYLLTVQGEQATTENTVYISSNNDGIKDGVNFDITANEEVKWIIDILDVGEISVLTNSWEKTYNTNVVKPVSCDFWEGTDGQCTGVNLIDGQYTVKVEFVDYGGNIVTNTDKSIVIDTIIPEGSLSGVPEIWQNTDVIITLSCSDDRSGCDDTEDYYGIADTQEACIANIPYADVGIVVDSNKWFCWKVTDNAGNIDTGSSEIKIDKTVPSITHTQPVLTRNVGETTLISTTVKDPNGLAEIEPVKLYYTINDITGDPVIMTNTGGDTYTGTILESTEPGTVTYYITATDSVVNTARDPEGTAVYTITVNDFSLSLASGWNLISVPKRLESSIISDVFVDTSVSQSEIYSYNAEVGDWNTEVSNINPGYGYWVKDDSAESIGINYEIVNETWIPPSIQLQPGWNLIGHMCTGSQLLENVPSLRVASTHSLFVLNYNEDIDEFGVCALQGSEWSCDTTYGTAQLETGRGYWLFSDTQIPYTNIC